MSRPLLALAVLGSSLAGAIKIVTPTPVRPSPVSSGAYRPSDPLYPRQWDMEAIHMRAAWALSRGAPVTVAVLDTGFTPTSELAGRVFPGYDFVSSVQRSGDGDGYDPDPTDPGTTAYHGTLVAQVIGAAHDGRGIAGVNPQARIVMVRVADTAGTIDAQDLADAIRWSAGLPVEGVPPNPRPAKVLNLSLFVDFIPLTGCDARVQSALDEVAKRGVVVVAGAANDGARADGYTPAGCRGVITVTATDDQGLRPAYANFGPKVALAAPGGTAAHGITTALPQSPGEQNGTSLAAPHVSGVVSLMLGLNPALTPAGVLNILRQTAQPFPGGRCDPDPQKTCGAGLLDAGKALAAAKASRK